MIALWMLAAVVIAATLGLAAAAAERVARVWRRPTRHAWTVALLGALLLPAVAAVVPRVAPVAPAVADGGSPPSPRDVRILPAIVVRPDGWLTLVADRLTPLDRPLAALWLAGSVLTFGLVARGALGLARARRAWQPDEVDGTPVFLANDVGPAVVGLRRPAIVLPAWALTLDAPLQALVVRHELEHVRARDPLQLALGAAAVTLMPWNPALWWGLRRLRAALEIDCDARVLAAAHAREDRQAVSRYGLLLLAVAQRRATAAPFHTLAGAPALAESTSDLSRRIDAMRSPLPRHRVLRTLFGTAAASAAVALAVAACAGSRDVLSPQTSAGRKPIEADKVVETAKTPPGTRILDPLVTTASGDSVAAMLPAGDGTLRPGMVSAERAAAARQTSRGPRAATRAPLPMKPTIVNGPYFEFQVEQPVATAPGSMGPRYPDELKAAKVEGVVVAQYVVDTTGQVEVASFKVLKSDHDDFTQAVKGALATMKFEPARVGGRAVRQLVQQPFQFSLTK